MAVEYDLAVPDAAFQEARREVFLALLANPAMNEKLMFVATSTADSVSEAAKKVEAAAHVRRLGELAHYIVTESRHAGRSA